MKEKIKKNFSIYIFQKIQKNFKKNFKKNYLKTSKQILFQYLLVKGSLDFLR